MILASHGLIASQIASFDADAVAFFGRVTTAGGSLSATEKAAVNTLVVDMKAASIWTSMKAIYPMVGASAAACAQNLKSSSFTGTFSGSVTFASTGVQGNGTTGLMNTAFNPSVQSTSSSVHMSLYSRTNQNRAEFDFSRQAFGLLLYQNTFYIQLTDVGSYATSISISDTRGMWIISRTNGTNVNGYRNATKLINNAAQVSTLVNNNLLLMANDPSGSNASSKEYAFASIGDGLDDTQAGNFNTAVQAFQTTLSRNV
jgi:hypothetical protein